MRGRSLKRLSPPPPETRQYSRVAGRGLTPEERRNVSGSAGRIPQPSVTGSLLFFSFFPFFSFEFFFVRPSLAGSGAASLFFFFFFYSFLASCSRLPPFLLFFLLALCAIFIPVSVSHLPKPFAHFLHFFHKDFPTSHLDVEKIPRGPFSHFILDSSGAALHAN